MQFVIRMFIAALAVVFIYLAVPLFLQVIGLSINGPLYGLFKLAVAALAIVYVIWGKPVPNPFV